MSKLISNHIHRMTTYIRICVLSVLAALILLTAACEVRTESEAPVPTASVSESSVAPATLPTPVPTTTPDVTLAQTPTPTLTPGATPEPTQPVSVIGRAVCTAKESVNIRETADKNSAVLGALPAGETVEVLAYEDGWSQIEYRGIVGYVNRDYLIGSHTPGIDVPMGDWAAVLVNPTHLLPNGFSVPVADFEGGQVDARIYDIATQMFADAAQDGVEFKLVDAYRSFDRQNELYQQKVNSYIAKGYSREDAEKEAATITARPNTSEHQTGLALDVVTPSYTKRDKGFAKTDAFKWLEANAQEYGFTLRYKPDKQEYTKVIYEPWHWRFVGVEAAMAMAQSGQCLEEYLGAVD